MLNKNFVVEACRDATHIMYPNDVWQLAQVCEQHKMPLCVISMNGPLVEVINNVWVTAFFIGVQYGCESCRRQDMIDGLA